MVQKNHFSLSVVTSLLLLAAMPVYSDEPTTTAQPQSSAPAQVMTQPTAPQAGSREQETQDLVKSGAKFIKENTKEAALAEFNNKNGKFSTKNSSYIFAVAYTGEVLASANKPETVGTNQLEPLNPSSAVYRNLIEKAKTGGGWVQYRWKNPASGQEECKKSFVQPMGDYLIGSGFYYAPNAAGQCE